MAGACRKAAKHRARSGLRSAPPWIALAPIALAFGCVGSATPTGGDTVGTTSSAIYGGVEDSDGAQNAGVVALKVGDGTTVELCTGSLVAPNVVLTARHCVSVQTSTTISCDQNGNSLNGSNFGADQPVASIHVLTGATPNLAGPAVANAKAVFHSSGDVLCNGDVALVVLDQPITTIAPLRVRLAAPVKADESVRSVGYGQNDQGLPIGTRFRRDGVSVLAVGSTVSSSQTALGSNEFEVGESICEGDSGGPALSEQTGAVIGVVSRGGACTDTYGHVYESLSGFASLFQQAFAVAGGAPTDESASAEVDAGTGGGSGSSGGSSGGGDNQGSGSSGGTVNLRAGAGNNCSVGGAPADGGSFAIPLGALALSMLLARRRTRA
jgi:MYXO-CTERM domain-containing protein